MELFLRGAGLVLVGVVLTIVVGRQSPDLSLVLSLAVCCCICIPAAAYLGSMMDLLGEIRRLGNLDRGVVSILLKCAGIGFIGELACLICQDAGQNAMAKALQILSGAAMIYLSIPMLRMFLELLEEVLGKV